MFYFNNNLDVYISKSDVAGATTGNTRKISIKSISYDMSTDTKTVNRDTLDPTQNRAVYSFVQAISAVNLSITTYAMPALNTVLSPAEEYLFAGLLCEDTISNTATSTTIDFANGNVATPLPLTLWIRDRVENSGIVFNNVVVDSVSIKFVNKELVELVWNCMAISMTPDNNVPLHTDYTIYSNYIKPYNNIFSLSMNSISYSLGVTTGTISIENNISSYGRIKILQTTTVEGFYTGNRIIKGEIDFYKKSGVNGSVDLINNINSAIYSSTYEDTHSGDLSVTLGSTDNNIVIDIAESLFKFPNTNISDVLTVGASFEVNEVNTPITIQYNKT